jgi:uncharacterized protein
MNLFNKLATATVLTVGLTAPASAQDLKMATIAPGTSAYLAMTTMATLVNQNLDGVNIQVDATGAATKHMIEVAQGKLDMSMTSPTVYDFMKNGAIMYSKLENAKELAENLQLVYWFPLGQYHIVAYADSGIETPADLKGKRIFLGPPGGGAYAAAKTWVKIISGYEPDVDFDPVKASWSSAFQGFQDRQFDVYITSGIAPFPQLEQLSLTSEVRLIGLSKDEFEANPAAQDFVYNVRGEELGIIPTGIYGDGVVNTEDVYTLGAVVGVTARKDLDADLIYDITKTYWEASVEAAKTNPWLGDITLEYAVQDGGMSLHPGALRYYEEIGLAIPDGSR